MDEEEKVRNMAPPQPLHKAMDQKWLRRGHVTARSDSENKLNSTACWGDNWKETTVDLIHTEQLHLHFNAGLS